MRTLLIISTLCFCIASFIGCDSKVTPKPQASKPTATPEQPNLKQAKTKVPDSDNLQNEKINLPEGIDAEQTSDDASYGYTKENPVKIGTDDQFGGPKATRLYLNHLRDAQFKPFTFERTGSVGGSTDGHMLDLYKLTAPDGKTYELYVDMYHPDISPLDAKAPKGMYFLK